MACLRDVFAKPIAPCLENEVPRYHMPLDTEITITEEASAEAAAWSAVYRGLVSTGVSDIAEIEIASPMWLLEFLLGNRILAKEPSKVTFVLTPYGGPSRAGLDELPVG